MAREFKFLHQCGPFDRFTYFSYLFCSSSPLLSTRRAVRKRGAETIPEREPFLAFIKNYTVWFSLFPSWSVGVWFLTQFFSASFLSSSSVLHQCNCCCTSLLGCLQRYVVCAAFGCSESCGSFHTLTVSASVIWLKAALRSLR